MEVYFDNSATTRVSDRVLDIVVKTMREDYGNPSAKHRMGVKAERYVKEAAAKIAKTLKVQEKEILFTSGGLANQLLKLFGAQPAGWYGDSAHATAIIILLRLWEFGSAMVIFLSALRDIPREYHEAAKVDGCGSIRGFFAITLPLLKDVIFLNLILQTISALQEFNAPYMITGGGPMGSTTTVGMVIYDEMFRYHNAGYANAVSWTLFVTITAVVLLLFKVTGRIRKEHP